MIFLSFQNFCWNWTECFDRIFNNCKLIYSWNLKTWLISPKPEMPSVKIFVEYITSTITSIWLQCNIHLDICSLKLTVFLELHSLKICFSELIRTLNIIINLLLFTMDQFDILYMYHKIITVPLMYIQCFFRWNACGHYSLSVPVNLCFLHSDSLTTTTSGSNLSSSARLRTSGIILNAVNTMNSCRCFLFLFFCMMSLISSFP